MRVVDSKTKKVLMSKDYNFSFDKETGVFHRWGKTYFEDPQFCPYGPEILDLEISVGDCAGNCPWCYKANSIGNGYHMSLETFKEILDKMPATLTQVALGLTDISANKDLIPILKYSREKGIVPNFTLAGYGLTEEILAEVAPLVGAIAVSVYPHNKELAYETARRFLQAGVKQTNFHLLYYQENKKHVLDVLNDYVEELAPKVNAIVLLALKTKGRAESGFTPMPQDMFNDIVLNCLEREIPIGFDSCSAPKFEKFARSKGYDHLLKFTEPCESALMSSYIDVHGNFYPCSFMEGIGEWTTGISVLDSEDFLTDVWYHPRLVGWRENLLNNCRNCPVFTI